MRTCVTPEGTFRWGVHRPSYQVRNLRQRTRIEPLGATDTGALIDNARNFPSGDLTVPDADWIYEIANPLPFRGTTFIGKPWADRNAADYNRIRLAEPEPVSFSDLLAERAPGTGLIERLPRPLQLALATTSTDPRDLELLARCSCRFVDDGDGRPAGLRYQQVADAQPRPLIVDHDLFEAVANNPALPADYRIAMVIRPGAQGGSEIVGDFHRNATHIHEYLRRNSYIGGGHYAANMAEDAIRYAIGDLSSTDMTGLRHLYYQRSYARIAEELGIEVAAAPLSPDDLETLRRAILAHPGYVHGELAATLWGWNFGFDFAPTGYRLHASHQQIHQQFAMIPRRFDTAPTEPAGAGESFRPFSCGDLIAETIDAYRARYDREFFCDYLQAIETNRRFDDRFDRDAGLVVWRDARVLLFVPKAQTSQWELQIMTLPAADGSWPGNIIECDRPTRDSLDTALLKAQQALAGRGVRMVTSIEYAKRFASEHVAQPLLYSLLPKLPHSPGAFSEAQLRFISGHYPEDFAAVCRQSLAEAD